MSENIHLQNYKKKVICRVYCVRMYCACVRMGAVLLNFSGLRIFWGRSLQIGAMRVGYDFVSEMFSEFEGVFHLFRPKMDFGGFWL